MRVLVGVLAVLASGVALVATARGRLHRRIDDETRALLSGARAPGSCVVEARELEKLPPPVRRWLEASGAVGRARAPKETNQ